MSFGDIVYIIVAVLFSYMTFVIIRNNFRSKFDEEQRRKELRDTYEDTYVSSKNDQVKEKD